MSGVARRARTAAAVAAVTLLWLALPAAPALAWTPEPATYGVGEQANLPVTMKDGTVLYANVYYPTSSSGAAAPGPFPVILTQTPYGKNNGALAGAPTYLVQRGYIAVVADVRGTGSSEGEWGLFDPVQGHDGATLVDWSAKLPHADGDVGLLGESYMGINQFETAADAGSAHVKALFPIIAGNDLYRDTAFAGGFPDIEFSAIYLALTGSLNTLLPATQYDSSFATAMQQHVHDLVDFDAYLLGNAETGGDTAYDQAYWGARNPNQYIAQIVHDGIPAYLIGGWYDLFQRGELLNYSYFQNAWAGRPVEAPMAPDQPVTPRYQLLMGPWYHVTAGDGLDYHGLDLNGIELAWFDHWLKGVDTGITDTTTPLHLEDLASGRYAEASRYPLDQATPQAYYLHAGGTLTPQRPGPGDAKPDTVVWTGSEIPCTSSTEQWAAGLGPLALSYFGLKDPCTQSTGLSQQGPGVQDYTTAPFRKATTLAGPVAATLYATTTTTDAEWVVQLSDVAPNGTATALTSGLLEGNQRALDAARTWYAADGHPLLPYHPYTKAAQRPITPGRVTRFDVEIFPTFDTLAPGHRLRVTIATADFPHALPSAQQLANLTGGVYEIEHSAAHASSVELPLATAAAANGRTPFPSATRTPLGCPAATGRLTASNVGPARLGRTRAQVRRSFARSSTSSTRGRKTIVVYCLHGSGIRVGYLGGRAVLVLTANRHYALRGVRPGARLTARLRHRLRTGRGYAVGRNTWYVVALGRGRGVLKVQRGRIGEIGVAAPARVRTSATARRFFRSFR